MKQRFLIISTILILLAAISTVFVAAQTQMEHAQSGFSVAYFNSVQSTINPSSDSFNALTLTLRNYKNGSGSIEYQMLYQLDDGTQIKAQQIVLPNDMVIVPAPDSVRTWFREHQNQDKLMLRVSVQWEDQTITLKKVLQISPQ